MSDENRDLKRHCKALYVEGFSHNKIVELTGVSIHTLRGWIYGDGWSKEYNEQTKSMVKDIVARSGRWMAKTHDIGIQAVYQAIQKRAERGPLSIGEAKVVMSILTDIQALRTIDATQPLDDADRTSTGPLTIADVHEALKKDVFTSPIPLLNPKRGIADGEITDVDSSAATVQANGNPLHQRTGRGSEDSSSPVSGLDSSRESSRGAHGQTGTGDAVNDPFGAR